MYDPTEARLLAAIAAGDESARGVYADWLDENGHAARAEFMRLQLTPSQATSTRGEPDALVPDATLLRLRELAATIDIAWRMQVARPVIEGCAQPRCPKEWGSLPAGPLANIRKCGVCVFDVHYCVTEDEVLKATGKRQMRVADLVVPRTRELCMNCGRTNERRHPFCIFCGADLPARTSSQTRSNG